MARRQMSWRGEGCRPPVPCRDQRPAARGPTRPRPRPAGGSPCSRSPRSASSTATSAPARSTRSGSASAPSTGCAPTPANVLGVLSLIFWSLILVVSVKYLALHPARRQPRRGRHPRAARARSRRRGAGAGAAGLVAPRALRRRAALRRRHHHAGDLGARRGRGARGRGARRSSRYVVPITVVILLALFFVQQHGTARVGARVRPDHARLVRRPSPSSAPPRSRAAPGVLRGAEPVVRRALLRSTTATHAFLVLGAVVLASPAPRRCTRTWATSAAGRSASRGSRSCCPRCCSTTSARARCSCAMPRGGGQPVLPARARAGPAIPLVVLATLAAIVASQALISGAFSLAQQAVQLGYCPRLTIVHTSRREAGQIYIPEVNAALMVGCLLARARLPSRRARSPPRTASRSPARWPSPRILFSVVARAAVGLVARSRAGSPAASSSRIDLAFLGANLVKIAHGGWVPLVDRRAASSR